REDAIYTKAELVVGDDGKPQQMPWEDWREGDDEHTSAWVRATASSGAAAYEGTVQWSGELGYGERPAELGQSADTIADSGGDVGEHEHEHDDEGHGHADHEHGDHDHDHGGQH